MNPRVKVRPSTAAGARAGTSSLREYRRLGALMELGADQTLETGGDAHTRAFWRYVTSPIMFGGDPREALDPVESRVLSKATSDAGGYIVPVDFADGIEAARRARGVIGNIANTLSTDNGQTLQVPTATAHGTASWTSENSAFTASDETFGQISLGAYKAAAKVIVSEELLTDAGFDLDAYLSQELGARLAVLEETAFAVGDGTGKPLGIAHSTSGITTVVAATGSATGFTLADVRAAWAALPAGYKPNASWVMSPSAAASLANLVGTGGALTLPSLHTSPASLYARPVYISSDMPTAAANARSVVVGDFSIGYAVRRVRSFSVQRQNEVHSDTGQVGFRTFERVDGRVILADAMRVLVNSAT